MFNTKSNDVYIASAIKECWKFIYGEDSKFCLSRLQSIDVQEVDNYYELPTGTINERVDSVFVDFDDYMPDRHTNTNVIGVYYVHLHRQERSDNYCCTVYVKSNLYEKN